MTLIHRTAEAASEGKSTWLLFLIWLTGSFCFWWLLGASGPHIELRVALQSPKQDVAQLFYDRGGGGYSESESISRSVGPGENQLTFVLPAEPIFQLRFDPVNSASRATITHIEMRHSLNSPWQQLSLSEWLPIATTAITRNPLTLSLVQGATTDPQLQFIPKKPLSEIIGWEDRLQRLLLAGLLAVGVTMLLRGMFKGSIRISRAAIPMAMAAVGGLILAMAVTSTTKSSVHPDEYSHLGAYQYYENHWLPPPVDNPATIPSTSIWGYSYLSELDVVYDVAAHLTAPLVYWMQDELRAARMFQVGLWAILCGLALCCRRWAMTLSVVLLSPQIWYVFSYFNADAFPLFLSLIAAGLIADETNGLHRFLRNGAWRVPAVWLTAICMGLLLVSKRNFLPVVPAFLLWLAVVHLQLRARFVAAILGGFLLLGSAVFIAEVPQLAYWHTPLLLGGFLMAAVASGFAGWHFWKDARTRVVLLRLVALALLCVAVALPRIAWDTHVNGWPSQKSDLVQAVKEARAGHDFKPSVAAQGQGNETIGLAAHGVPLGHLVFAPYRWLQRSIVSAFGVYGYMNIFAPAWIYVVLVVLTGLIVLLAISGLRKSQPENWRGLTSVFVGCAMLIFTGSMMLSWIDALQPQGRYLLPIVALLALLIAKVADPVRKRAFVLFFGAAFLLSAASYAFVALPAFANGG